MRTFLAILLGLIPISASAQTTTTVTSAAQLQTAITSAAPGDTIVLGADITLTADLPAIAADLRFDGAGHTISGDNQFRGLVVGNLSAGPVPVSVSIENVSIVNTVAQGGNGGTGAQGGGGGAGLGGALFVASSAQVTLSNVNISAAQAIGGNGGAGGVAGANNGGGGGMGGDGGAGTGGTRNGGGGGAGSGAVGGNNSIGGTGLWTGAPSGGAGGGGMPGGAQGGGGGADDSGAGGGGAGGLGSGSGTGGAGGYGGGGGGSSSSSGGAGGFGGGGGAGFNGVGGYGGGGGGTFFTTPNAGGFGGGTGGNNPTAGGGGGAGLGGAIFVDGTGSLTIAGALTVNGSTVAPGTGGGNGATNGISGGSGFFFAGRGVVTFAPGAGMTQTVSDVIADEAGISASANVWALNKTGAGTLVLSGQNVYGGGTTIAGGTISVSSSGNLGLGAVTIDGGTLHATANGDYTNSLFLGAGTLSAAAGTSLTWSGDINDAPTAGPGGGQLTITGGGTVELTGDNSYSGGTAIVGNSQVVVATDAVLGPGGGLTLGDASSRGTLSVTTGQTLATARAITLGAGGGVLDAQGTADVTASGTISGSGALTKIGTGTLTLSGGNSYSGGTAVNAGTLIAGGTNVFGSGGMQVGAGATLDLNGLNQTVGSLSGAGSVLLGAATIDTGGNNTSTTFSGSVSGTGALVKSGTGTLTLAGANSYSGGTTVSGGVLAGTTASLQGSILNNAAVAFAQSTNGTYAGTMTGSGTLFKTGAGTLTLTGANSYGGGTVIAGGAIAIAQDAALGAASGGVSLGDAASIGTLNFINAAQLSSLRAFTLGGAGGVFNTTGAAVTLAGDIGGTGGLTKIGAGTLELTHANSYTGSTVVAEGTLRSGAANAFGIGTALLVNAGAAVDLSGFGQSVSSLSGSGGISLGGGTLTAGLNNASGTFGGAISGSGSLVKTGAGTLSLTGANTYSGGTTVLGGVLAGTTSSLQGNILNNSTVLFDQNSDGTYGGSMSGSGTLMKSGSGLLTLNGNNTYTGGTVIAGGGIVASPTGLSGSILNNGSLIFGGPSGVFTGIIGGTGSVTKTGTGTMTMNSAQALTGLTSVAQGTLVMNGGTAGGVDVAAGATLRASGFIGGSLTLRGSLIATPATAPFAVGTLHSTDAGATALTGPPVLTIGSDFTALSGSRVGFDVGPGTNPTLLVGGDASLNGVHFDVTAPSIGNQRSGTFLALQARNSLSFLNSDIAVTQPNVEPLLTQTQNSLYVTLLNLNVPLAIDAGPAHKAVADAIDRSKFGATGDAATIVRELTALDTGGLQHALELLGGELHASVLHTAILDAETLADVVRDQLASREVEEGNDFRWWGETVCQHADFEESTRARGGTANICAGAGGGDRKFSSKWTLGFGGSWTDGAMRLGQLGSGDYSAPRAFGYAGYKPKNFGVRFGGSGAKSNYDTNRRIQFQAFLPVELGGLPLDQGVDRKAEAQQDGNTSDQWGEIHDSRKVRTYTLDGLLGVRHARVSRSSFAESGAISISLDGADEILNLTQTDVKARVWRREGTYRPFADFSYRRELAEDGTQAAVRFDGLPASDFIVEGINIPASSYSLRGGLTIALPFGQATTTYEYKRAQGQRRHIVGFRMRFN